MDFSEIFSGFSRNFPGFFSGIETSIFYEFVYGEKNIFYDKKIRESQFPEIATCRPCNRE